MTFSTENRYDMPACTWWRMIFRLLVLFSYFKLRRPFDNSILLWVKNDHTRCRFCRRICWDSNFSYCTDLTILTLLDIILLSVFTTWFHWLGKSKGLRRLRRGGWRWTSARMLLCIDSFLLPWFILSVFLLHNQNLQMCKFLTSGTAPKEITWLHFFVTPHKSSRIAWGANTGNTGKKRKIGRIMCTIVIR